MVDALNEARRVLRPNGVLIDYRPIVSRSPIEVITGDHVLKCGVVDDSSAAADSAAADASTRSAVAEGWFVARQHAAFEVEYYWDTVEEMSLYFSTRRHPMRVLPS